MDSSDNLQSNGAQNSDQMDTAPDDPVQSESSGIADNGARKKRTRIQRPYPIHSFEDALQLAVAIQQHASGKPVRRITLFDTLKKSPESSQSRDWVTSASRYGLINGSSHSETLELTEEGKIASGEEYSEYEQTQARVNLAILHVPTFKTLYDELKGNKFPSRQFLADIAEKVVDESLVTEALDIFTVNVKFVGLLRVMSGVERLISLEHLLELVSGGEAESGIEVVSADEDYVDEPPAVSPARTTSATKLTLDDVCFYVSPIGEPGSEQRQHADLFLSYIIQPALEGTGLKVVRADKIDRPGIISSQIIRHLLRSRLVIADLSFHNPNVFYELAIRHASRLPTVHTARMSDPIPFDVNQMRTIRIDSTSIYTLIPQLDTYKAEIATQVRRALDGEEDTDNPISVFYPSFHVAID